MVTFISGLLYAIINVILPHGATLHARQKAAELGELVISSTRMSVLLLVLSGIPILFYAGPIVRLWIGDAYVAKGTVLLAILIAANIIRLIGAPYSIAMVAAGQQSFMKVSPLVEGLSNFAASMLLGLHYGAEGIAYGTLIGAIAGMASHFWYSMPRTRTTILFERRRFLISGVLTPLFWTSPLLMAGVASWRGLTVPIPAFIVAMILSVAVPAALLLRAQRTVHA
jgi:O-antigen/teichoic acid export membrane protein